MKRLRKSLFFGGVVIAAIAVGTVAWAYWAAPGAGTASATVATLATPATPTATPTAGSNPVHVTWSPGVIAPDGGAVDGYYVEHNDGSSWTAACNSSSSSLLAASPASCDDTVTATGTYTYRVIAVWRSWNSTSAVSAPVFVQLDTIPPTTDAPGVTAANTFGTSPLFVTNETLHLTDNAVDTGGSGVASVEYSYCTDNGAGGCADALTSLGSSSSSAGNWPVTWATPLPADGTYRIVAVATDNANNVGVPSSATLIAVDSSGPTASAPGADAAVKFGTNPMFVNDENISLTDSAGDGSGSGVQSVTYSYCTDDGAGGCAGGSTVIGSSASSAGSFATPWTAPLPTDGTYRITAVATDNLGNAGSTSSATLVAVDKTPPAISRPIVNGHS
jgi:hypothetical protein